MKIGLVGERGKVGERESWGVRENGRLRAWNIVRVGL